MQNFAQAPENGSISILLRRCVVSINRDVISVSTNHVRLQSNLTPKDSPLASAPKFYASARILLLAYDYACVVRVNQFYRNTTYYRNQKRDTVEGARRSKATTINNVISSHKR